MDWSWLFLLVTIVGALFTFNAYLPRPANSLLAAPSFFAGWLTSELVAHHFAWQLAATLFFVWAGALDAWPGWLGLGITFASWAALLAMVPVARRSEHEIEDALQQGLGADYRDAAEPGAAKLRDAFEPQGRLVNPFRFRHPEVRVVHDIRYAEGAGKRHLLDVYTPRDGTSGAPVLLQIHGGGWTIGHKRQQALPLMNHLAARGWVCVAANYRLSPRATFPEHIVDVKLAIRWIREHIAEYGGDARLPGGDRRLGRRASHGARRAHRERPRVPARLRGRRHPRAGRRALLRRLRLHRSPAPRPAARLRALPRADGDQEEASRRIATPSSAPRR